MSEGASRTSDIGAAARSGFERALERACTWLAIAGGVVMLAFTAASVASIVSRTLFGSPLVGDFELTERGTAIAVFAMVPYCHLRGGHVVVDMFVGMLPPAPRRVLAIAAEVLFALVAALMTWRLALGGLLPEAVAAVDLAHARALGARLTLAVHQDDVGAVTPRAEHDG